MVDIQRYDYCNETIKLKENIEQSFLFLGERLQKIRNENLYSDGWETFEDYLQELDMSKSVASKLITIFETFSVRFPIPPEQLITSKGWTNLYEIATIVQSREDCDYWMSEWSVLGSNDLRVKIRENKTGIEQATCEHSDNYLLRVCRICGARHQEYEKETSSKI